MIYDLGFVKNVYDDNYDKHREWVGSGVYRPMFLAVL